VPPFEIGTVRKSLVRSRTGGILGETIDKPDGSQNGAKIMILRSLVIAAAAVAALCGAVAAVAPAGAAEAVFPAASRIGIVPPPGFVASKRFPGFENPDSAGTIMMMTLPPQLLAQAEATLTQEAVKAQGITEDRREAVTLPNGTAQLVAGTEEENGQKFRKWMFLALMPEGVAVVAVRIKDTSRGAYPDEVIHDALASLAVRSVVPVDEELGLLPFRLADLAGMRPVRVLGGNGVVLTDGPKDTPEPSEQPVFVVSFGQGGPEQAGDRANFARNLFTGLADFKDLRIVSGDMLRLGGGTMPTHELQAEASDGRTGTPMKLVQWVRFGSGVFIRMVGVARADQWSKAFTQFRTVREGVGSRE
jgi:hypothetical protein